MKTLILVTLCGLLALGEARPAAAQATAADTAAVLLGTAQRLQQEGNPQLARAILRLIVRAYPGTPAADDAQAQLAALRRSSDSTSGRVELIVWGTGYGAWLGIALPLAAGADSPEPYGAGLLTGTPLGFFGARAFGRAYPISLGQARMIRFASMWGAWQGHGWQQALNIGRHTVTYCDQFTGNCFQYQEDSDRAPTTMALVGSLVGLGTGIALARSVSISPGTAAMIEFSGYWATWYGVASGVLFDWGDDRLLTLTLLAGDAGVLAASLIAPKVDISVGRARLISVTGLAGALAGLGLDLLMDVQDDKAAIAIPMAASFAGLGLGVAWTKKYDTRTSDEIPGASGLLNLNGGRVGLGVPAPLPAALPTGFDGQRVRRELGVKVSLLHATF
jgi:hypothetical protein